jgi:hypothetical protein
VGGDWFTAPAKNPAMERPWRGFGGGVFLDLSLPVSPVQKAASRPLEVKLDVMALLRVVS